MLQKTFTKLFRKKKDIPLGSIPEKDLQKYYLTIDTLPLWNYIRASETKDYRYLLILDNYNTLPVCEVNENVWVEISMQCFEATGDRKAKNYIDELKKILLKRELYRIITDSTFVLCYNRDPDIIKIVENKIKIYSPNFQFKFSTDKEYYESVIEIDRQAKGILSEIEMLTQRFEKKYKSEVNSQINYHKVVASMSKFYGYQINTRTLTVKEFLTMGQEMNDTIKKQKENGRR